MILAIRNGILSTVKPVYTDSTWDEMLCSVQTGVPFIHVKLLCYQRFPILGIYAQFGLYRIMIYSTFGLHRFVVLVFCMHCIKYSFLWRSTVLLTQSFLNLLFMPIIQIPILICERQRVLYGIKCVLKIFWLHIPMNKKKFCAL